MVRTGCLMLVLAVACGGDEEAPATAFDDAGGLLGEGLMNPFPTHQLIQDGEIVVGPLDLPYTQTPFPLERIAWRAGFSPAQVSTLRLPGVSKGELPRWNKPTPGEGGVILIDLTAGSFLPVMAEKDAWPDAVDPTLLIRPLVAVPVGHDVAVVVTTATLERPERFETILHGNVSSALVDRTRAIVSSAVALGIPENEIALAWSYPVSDGTIPTRSAVSQIDVPGSWDFTQVRLADDGDDVPDDVWRNARGSFETTDFLVDGDILDMNPDGTVNPTGSTPAMLVVSVPQSVRDAPAGSVPILFYGHGLLSSPDFDLIDGDWAPHRIADELGMILVATSWRGLDYNDLVSAVAVANDFGRMPTLSDKMIQGQANAQALIRLVRDGALLDDPLLAGAQGQRLGDPDRIYYWGISMGSILGGVFMALDTEDAVSAGVLHVPGAAWSSLLERSRNWSQFEIMVTAAMDAPEDRQIYYAASQLFWDAVDPIAYSEELQSELLLLQESYGDDAVHNMTTRMLARSIGLPLLTPAVDAPWGMDAVAADLPPGSRALVQYDPEVGTPDNKNRPAGMSGAHDIPVRWEESRAQAVDFLTPGAEGRVVHYCGGQACSRSSVAR